MTAAAAVVLLVALVADDPGGPAQRPPRRRPRPGHAVARGLAGGAGRERPGSSGSTTTATSAPATSAPRRCASTASTPASAPELAAVVRFLRDAAGYESLGIGYAALALRAAPAGADTSELLASIGTMADRLARRASARRADAQGRDAGRAHRGRRELRREVPGRRRATRARRGARTGLLRRRGVGRRPRLAGRGARRAGARRAVPGGRCLPRPRCRRPAEARAWNDRRLQALRVDRLRRGGRAAGLARRPGAPAPRRGARLAGLRRGAAGNAEAAARAEAAAVRELALCDRGVLAARGPRSLRGDVAIRVAASRWATETPPKANPRAGPSSRSRRAQPGETCVRVTDGAGDRARRLGERCTFGVVWPSALRWAPSGDVATVAVQPLPAWTELWVLRRGADGTWAFETLTPATTEPDIGYVESAGFSPDGRRRAPGRREARAAGRLARALPGRRRRLAGGREVGQQRRQAGRLQALERALLARRHAGAAVGGPLSRGCPVWRSQPCA